MKNFRLSLLTSLCFLSLAGNIHGQSPAQDLTEQAQKPYSPSPQTWGFVKHGNTPVDLYTGTARVDIPVYTYEDEDFTVPVSLAYASGGFIPNQQTGPLGLNWTLIAGGVIAREIRGLDDFYGNENGIDGFLRRYSQRIDDEKLLCNGTKEIGGTTYWGDLSNKVETQSDIYHFNFAGHSGTFHFNGNKECVVYNTEGDNGAYKVEYSNPNDTGLSFTITTPNGYKYIFGSDEKKEESEQYFERILTGEFIPNRDLTYRTKTTFMNPIVSWYLHKIVAPNGREVRFTYSHYKIAHNPNNVYGKVGDNNYVVTFRKRSELITELGFRVYKTPTILKTTYLSRIDIDNKVSIDFTYFMKDSKEADPNVYTQWPQQRYLDLIQQLVVLGKIHVEANGTTLRDCMLRYDTVDFRPFLSSVTITGQGAYKMDYYHNHPLPDLLSDNYDFWDYSNGRDLSESSVFSGTVLEYLDEYVAPRSAKLPDAQWSIQGNLKKITYPTGGSTTFEYEANRARYAVLKRSSAQGCIPAEDMLSQVEDPIVIQSDTSVIVSPFMAKMYPIGMLRAGTDEIGGIRIRKITDDNGTGRITIREYDYLDKSDASSGNLLRFPRLIAYKVGNVPFHYDFLATSRTSFDKTHIEYSRVVERRSDGTKTEYNFTNYRNTPDDYESQRFLTVSEPIDEPEYQLTVTNNMFREPNSRHYRRGKMWLKIIYDKSGEPVVSEEYTYRDHNSGVRMNYSAYAINSAHLVWSAKLYTGDYRLTRKKDIRYTSDGTISQEKYFTFTPTGRLRGSYTKFMDGAVMADSLVYASERMPTPAEQALVDKNMDCPVEVVRTVTDRRGKKQNLRWQLYDYTLTESGLPVLFQGRERTVTEAGTKDRILFQNTRYSNLGRLLERWDIGGITTTYLWGYGGLYPVAKIENGVFDNIAAMLYAEPGMEHLDVAFEKELSGMQESALRSCTDGLVTTYRYLPHVGITTITDPMGKKIIYEYDKRNRLSKIKNTSGQLLKEFEYSVTE